MGRIIFFLPLLNTLALYAQLPSEPVDSTSFRNIIKEMPSFTIYGDNYFVSGTTLGVTPSEDNSDAKFRLGFKQRLVNSNLPLNTYLFFTYRQLAFWDVYKKSLPFREINYNPGIALVKPLFNKSGFSGLLMFQFEHESNGRDNENSRSWNYISLYYFTNLTNHLSGSIKAWLQVGSMSENSDLTDYIGYHQVSLAYKFKDYLIMEAEYRKAFSLDLKGSLTVGLSVRLSEKSNQYLYLQYFGGYSENLIEYTESGHRLRMGITFKDMFLKSP